MSLVAALLAGCAGVHKRGTSRIDEYDAVQVDQMVGNNVTRKVFEKTILCLNARRETRTLYAITNQTVAWKTGCRRLPRIAMNLRTRIAECILTSAPSLPGLCDRLNLNL